MTTRARAIVDRQPHPPRHFRVYHGTRPTFGCCPHCYAHRGRLVRVGWLIRHCPDCGQKSIGL